MNRWTLLVWLLAGWSLGSARLSPAQEATPPAKKAPADDFFREEPGDAPAPKVAEPAPSKDAEPPAEAPAAPPSGTLPPSRPSAIEEMYGPPQTLEDFWQVIDRDLRFGLIDDAVRHATLLMQRQDLTPERVLELRERFGSSLLVRLQTHPELRKISAKLVEMANEAAGAKARDEARLRRYIGNLGKSASERAFAIDQLRAAGPAAVPLLVEAFRVGDVDRVGLIEAFFDLPRSTWPAVATLLDSGEPELLSLALDVLRNFRVPESADPIWYVAGNTKNPIAVREHAFATLSYLTGKPIDELASPVEMLHRIARRYYRGEGEYPLRRPDGTVEIWHWQDGAPRSFFASVADAEEYYGTRYAREALALSPTNLDAKVLLLGFALERDAARLGIENAMPQAPRGVSETALAAGPELLTKVLDAAIAERRTAVVLGAVRALGHTGDHAAVGAHRADPGVLAQALNYPDPRVQVAAAAAMLELAGNRPLPQSTRILQTLTRAALGGTQPAALVIDGSDPRGNALGSQLQQLGYRFRLARSGKEGFRMAAETGAFDLVLIDPGIQNWNLDQTLANFRADARTAGLPIVVFLSPSTEARRDRLQDRYPPLVVTGRFDDPAKMVQAIELGLGEGISKPLTAPEKGALQALALDWLLRIARGETAGLDPRMATDALLSLLPSPEAGVKAAEILGYLPSAIVQKKLAETVLAGTQPKETRLAAAEALARNIRRSSPGLASSDRQALDGLFEQEEDPALRAALARVVGALGPSSHEQARRIQAYAPAIGKPSPAAAAQAAKPAPEPAKPAAKSKPATEKKAAEKKSDSFFDE